MPTPAHIQTIDSTPIRCIWQSGGSGIVDEEEFVLPDIIGRNPTCESLEEPFGDAQVDDGEHLEGFHNLYIVAHLAAYMCQF